jgi:hypothetical protein
MRVLDLLLLRLRQANGLNASHYTSASTFFTLLGGAQK